jgi:hypothetical protein
MSEINASTNRNYESGIYAIRVFGRLNDRWQDWFDGLTIILEDSGETVLTGPVADQAALYGLLKKIRDLGMPLISVNRLTSDQTINTNILKS